MTAGGQIPESEGCLEWDLRKQAQQGRLVRLEINQKVNTNSLHWLITEALLGTQSFTVHKSVFCFRKAQYIVHKLKRMRKTLSRFAMFS